MEDTICALSTSNSMQAISIIRVSGNDSLKIVNSIFDKDITNVKSHTIHYGHIVYCDEIIDEVLLMIMLSPRTYTKEDIVEINCHGSLATTNKILEILLKSGCRMAMAGEFTKRAYLNGRIDLLEAESVNDLITAKTSSQRTLALNNLGGNLTKIIRNLREKTASILANIEVNIDYPEYTDELEVTKNLMNTYLKDIFEELTKLKNTATSGKIIKDGVNIAIIGRPNVGKSSILNNLLDEDKAIVTDIPGTTRDIVEGTITLNNVLVNFTDTAGIRKTNDIVEKIGVEKSEDTANKADLVLLVLNNNEELTDIDTKLLKTYQNDNLIIFLNKTDLPTKINLPKDIQYIKGNTKDLEGLNDLKKEIISKLKLDSIVNKDMCYLSNIRQIDLVDKALDSVVNALDNLKKDIPVDILEIDLKNAWNYLGEIIGDVYEDELVDKIFSNFCLGK